MDPDKIDKETKLKIADMLVKVLVPRLKSGEIGSKSIFKILARELTHRFVFSINIYNFFLK